MEAEKLCVGDQCAGPNGELQRLLSTVHEPHPQGIPVYNFQVEDYHTYFVNENGTRAPPALVHNADYVPEGTRVTRNWGGESGPFGQSWTRDPVSKQTRESLGLGRSNTGEFISHGRITDNTGITTRDALEWDGFKGGGDEVLIPDPLNQIELDAITMPDFPLPDR